MTLQFYGIESHNYLGARELYLAPLFRVFSVLRRCHPSLQPERCLCLSLKWMNEMMGPSGLVPTLLEFWALPCMAVTSVTYLLEHERIRALRSAREEMAVIIA